jgi:hypothetical protein
VFLTVELAGDVHHTTVCKLHADHHPLVQTSDGAAGAGAADAASADTAGGKAISNWPWRGGVPSGEEATIHAVTARAPCTSVHIGLSGRLSDAAIAVVTVLQDMRAIVVLLGHPAEYRRPCSLSTLPTTTTAICTHVVEVARQVSRRVRPHHTATNAEVICSTACYVRLHTEWMSYTGNTSCAACATRAACTTFTTFTTRAVGGWANAFLRSEGAALAVAPPTMAHTAWIRTGSAGVGVVGLIPARVVKVGKGESAE